MVAVEMNMIGFRTSPFYPPVLFLLSQKNEPKVLDFELISMLIERKGLQLHHIPCPARHQFDSGRFDDGNSFAGARAERDTHHLPRQHEMGGT